MALHTFVWVVIRKSNWDYLDSTESVSIPVECQFIQTDNPSRKAQFIVEQYERQVLTHMKVR